MVTTGATGLVACTRPSSSTRARSSSVSSALASADRADARVRTSSSMRLAEPDASSANGHWIFAGGLTNVEVQLIVTDTQTGIQKTYTNPINKAFQPIQDTNALAVCP